MDTLLTDDKILEKITLKGNFILRSGIKTDTYYDKYLLFSNPELLFKISTSIAKIINNSFICNENSTGTKSAIIYNYIAGLSTGGIPIATMLSQITNKKLCIVRKKRKLYGTKKIVEGSQQEGDILLVIEDVVTTGGQLMNSIIDIRGDGYIVNDAICIIDRGKDNQQYIYDTVGVKLHSLYKI